MSGRHGLRVAGLALAAILAAGSVTSGQETAPAPPPVPPRPATPLPSAMVERTTSELVLIEVYARDKLGRPLRDLVPGDLVLKIDGDMHPKPIVSLEWVEPPPAPPAGSTGAAPVTAAAGETPGHQAAHIISPSRRDWPRRFLLFFDDATSTFVSMTNARRGAMEYLERPGTGTDQFAVASYSELHKLEILQDFTSDRAAVRRALEKSLTDPTRMSDYAADVNNHQLELMRIQSESRMDPMGTQRLEEMGMKARTYATEDSAHMSRVLHIVRTLVDGLAPWPGYKALVFIGDGIPENPAIDYGLDDPRISLTSDLGLLGFAAGGSNVTLDVLQTQGVAAGSAGEMKAMASRSNAMTTLALDTGGVSRATNALAAGLADIETSAEGYYVLAYAPEGPPDGRSHTINLRGNRKGIVLRYRRTFTRFTPEEVRTRAIQAAYVAPELHADLGLDLVAVPGPIAGKERFVDLVIYVPAEKILFLPEPGGAAARLEVGLVAFDGAGREALRVARRVRVSVGATRAVSGGPLALELFSRVRLPAGGGTVTAAIADVNAGTVGSARVSFEGTGAEPPGVVGLSLYAVGEQSLWLEVDSREKGQAGTEVDLEPTVGPALRSRFVPGEKVAFGFRLTAPGATGGAELALALQRGGEEVRRRAIPMAGAGAPDMGGAGPTGAGPGMAATLHADVPVEGLADGEYLLCIEAARAGQPTQIGRLPFRIVPRRDR